MGLALPSFFSPVISFLDRPLPHPQSPHRISWLCGARWDQLWPGQSRGQSMHPHSSPSLTRPTPAANSGPCNSQSPAPSSLEILFYSASQGLCPPCSLLGCLRQTHSRGPAYPVLLARLTQSPAGSTIARLHCASRCKTQHFSAFCLKFLSIGHSGPRPCLLETPLQLALGTSPLSDQSVSPSSAPHYTPTHFHADLF